ncbi:T9SS type B sorting domain-containing protein [Lacinutrix iliipiscaria]|uniref:T9SS type B sorting domain-containing protein n=1 Tax=Lacinutrix iliipiscaria TaxID=1230532 RepID=A0ABW5WLS0_9FLAO
MKRLLTLASLLFINFIYAQGPGCPNVNAGPSQVDLDCNTLCTNLSATFLETGETTSYSVSSIPFNPPSNFNGLANQLFVSTDDIWSGIVNLPFEFCFFGVNYNQIVVGSNGVLSFDVSNANTGNEWAFTQSLPNNTNPTLAEANIFGAGHDIDPAASAGTHEIGWEVKGTAPCRTFVVSYFNVANFSCNALKNFQQMVLYEGTNTIEVYILDKPTCFTWNSGNAVIGIQNPAGTVAYTPPGRNTGNWSASVEAWRFTPNGLPNYAVTWYDGSGSVISNSPTVNVCPSADESFTVEVEYTNCDGSTFTDSDSVLVTVDDPTDPSFNMTATCDGGTATITGDGGGMFSFNPPPGDGAVIDPITGTVTGGTSGTTYSIQYSTPGNCDNSIETVTALSTGDASFTMTATCDGGTATITGDLGGTFSFNPAPGDGAVIDPTTGTVTGGTSGTTYTIEYATSGACADDSTETVTALSTGDASFTMTATCDGGTATITGDLGGTFSFNPAPGDGAVIDPTTGTVTGGTSGTTYTIEYATSGACADDSTETVTALSTGDASFNMTATCDGGTATITGDTGGAFTFNPVPGDGASIDPTTGTVTGGTSGTTYTIEYATTGSCAADSTETVTVLASEDATFNMTATCDGGTATITGDLGGTFAFNPAPGDGASIDTATGTVTGGTSGSSYTIEYTTSGTCPETTTENVTVLSTDDASFTMNPTCDGGTATITGTVGGTFAFNPAPGDGASIDTATGTVTGGISGSTYTIEYTTLGTCPDTSTEMVTVLSTGDASFNMTATCDGGTATITGTTGGAFTFNPVPGDGAVIDPTTGTVTGGTSGTTYTIEYATTGSCAADSTETVTVLASEDATFNMTATCDGGTATITGDLGGTFAFNPAPGDGASIDTATGTVTGGTSGSSYTIEYTTSGTCPETTTENVTVLSTDDASFTMNPTCDGGTATITGTVGGTFAFNPAPGDGASIDTATGTVTGGTSGTTYTIEYTTLGTCPDTSTEMVTVLSTGDASFNMTATCDGGTATITGTTGGTFTFNPVPGDGAVIDPTTGTVTGGTAGTTYTIEYATTGSCAADSTETVTVLASEDATFSMTATCDGGTATITGDLGGTFAFNPAPGDGASIDTATGTVTGGTSGSSYTIEYTTSGTCPETTTENVTVLSTDDASFTMNPTCDGGTATITGDLGGTFAFNPAPGDGASIDTATGTVTGGTSGTTYTIEYTTLGTCPETTTENVTVLSTDDASFNMTATCDGGTATITGTTGGTFTFNPAPGDGAMIDGVTGTITGGTSGATYTIEYITSGTCFANSTENVTVYPSEDASFSVLENCDGGTMTILGDVGGTFAFNPVPSDGASIDVVTGEVTGGVSGVTYVVEYTTAGPCAVATAQNVTVLTTDDASFTMTATCDGGTATITGTVGGTFAFNPAPGDGASIDMATGTVTGGTSGASYTIEYTTSGVCPSVSTQGLTVLTTDDASFTLAPTCDGGTATITGTAGGTFTFSPAPGDGAMIDGVTGTITGGTSGATYTIEYTTSGTCFANSTETVTVFPSEDASFTMDPTCDGGTATITGDIGGTFAFNPVPSDGASINSTTGLVTGGVSGETYSVEYTTAGPCAVTTTQNVTVIITDDASFTMDPTCDGGTATITGTVGGTFAFNPAPGDGASIDMATGTVTGGTSGASYTIEYTTSGVCPSVSTQGLTVLTTDDASFTLDPTCDGGTATITGTAGGTFTFNPVPGDGAMIDGATGTITNGTSNVTYTVEYTTPGVCPASSIEMVTVFPSEDASFTMNPGCGGGTANIIGDIGGTFAFNPVPSDGAMIDPVTGTVTNGGSGETYTVEYTTSGPCPESTTENVFIFFEDDASFTMTPNCDGATATVTGTFGGVFTFDIDPADGSIIDSVTGEVTNATPETTYSILYTTAGTCMASSVETFTVYPLPFVDLEDYVLCIDNDGNTVNTPIIETGLSTIDYSFEWTEVSNPGVVLGTDSTYEPTQAGTYSVVVTDNITGCSTVLGDPNTISIVTNSLPPSGLIAQVISETFADVNVIQASVDDNGATYEFSIDGGPFEGNGTNSFIFTDVMPGEHIITVRDANGCGDDSTVVLVVDYPLFFTPNNDGFNDTWQVVGIDNQLDAKIYIFDRYGKLLKQLSPNGAGWDGTFNGYPLPSSDYWFSLEYREPNNLTDSSKKEFKAHFTLKR